VVDDRLELLSSLLPGGPKILKSLRKERKRITSDSWLEREEGKGRREGERYLRGRRGSRGAELLVDLHGSGPQLVGSGNPSGGGEYTSNGRGRPEAISKGGRREKSC